MRCAVDWEGPCRCQREVGALAEAHTGLLWRQTLHQRGYGWDIHAGSCDARHLDGRRWKCAGTGGDEGASGPKGLLGVSALHAWPHGLAVPGGRGRVQCHADARDARRSEVRDDVASVLNAAQPVGVQAQCAGSPTQALTQGKDLLQHQRWLTGTRQHHRVGRLQGQLLAHLLRQLLSSGILRVWRADAWRQEGHSEAWPTGLYQAH
mmetsp:Transcript_38976/g.121399  ORF Transcript_38976/g.121399 Transcript_38976/m.121399 type:complete len:207 (-) Transcript_38976:138-758(-)